MTGQLHCPVCGYGNRPGAVVCEDCGLAIPQYQACAACGFMNTADSRFCGNCGTPVGLERKQSAGPSAPRTNPAPPPIPVAPAAAAAAPVPEAPVAPPPVSPPAPPALPPGPGPAPAPTAPQIGFPPKIPAPANPGPGAAPGPATGRVDPLVGRDEAPGPSRPGPTFKLVHDGTGVEIKLPLQEGALLIGRPGGDPDVDVSGFPEASVVSRKHARLIVTGSQVAIEDLGSANGTYLNNARVRGPSPVTHGDRIAFGQGAKVVFTVQLP